MATLKLSCKNQALEWENNSEEIIAGNIKIDKIAFEFCELWDGFTKTAVFRKDDKALLVLLDNDCICEMPPEVTQTSGIVYIGVFGVKGDQKRTTEVKGLYLAEGVVTDGDTPGEPTPDIYQQIVNLCTEAVETSKRVETETKELNEQSKAVLDAEAERMAAEEYRQYSEDERKNNELLRDEHESNRQGAEEERQQSFEELKSETGILQDRMNEGLSDFENEGQNALDQFQADTSTVLSGFDVEKQQALDHFAEQSAEELEKVQTATDRANEAVDNMPNVYANVLKGNASGEIISLTDISPIEHNLGVKLSSDTITDFSTTTLNALGKNIYNPKGRITPKTEKGLTIQYLENEDCYLLNGTSTTTGSYYMLNDTILVDDYISFACEVVGGSVDNPDKKYMMFYVGYKDSEDDSRKNWTSITLEDGTSVAKLSQRYIGASWFYIADGITFDNYKVRVSVEKGVNANKYAPYIEPTSYTPNADGTVANVKSIYPTTTLVPSEQGVLVECGYNRDLNKAFEEITNAIIALGGNV